MSCKVDNLDDGDDPLLFCAFCGELVLKMEKLYESVLPGELQYPGVIFQFICKLFGVHSEMEEGEDKEMLSCGNCLEQLGELMQLQKQLEEVEQLVMERKQELKVKVEISEELFLSMGMYDRDERYLQVRNVILKRDALLKSSKVKKVTANTTKKASRRSVRNSKKEKIIYNDVKEENLGDSVTERLSVKATEKLSMSRIDLNFANSDHLSKIRISSKLPLETKGAKQKGKQSGEGKSQKKKRKPCPSDDDEDWKPSEDETRPRSSKISRNSTSASSFQDELEDANSGSHNFDTDCDDACDGDDKDEFTSVRQKMEFDPATGACTLFNVTLDKVDIDNYKCRICNEIISGSNPKNLRYHVVREHTKTTTCKECGAKFREQSRLTLHIRHVHQGVQYPRKGMKLECPICGKKVASPVLQRHQWTHYSGQEKLEAISRGEKNPRKRKKIFQCDICGQQISNEQNLLKHKIAIHPTPGETREKQMCPECGKKVYHLQNHMKSHRDEVASRKFICSFCSKGFPSMRKLTVHKRFHELSHKCTICEKAFPSKPLLERHMNWHLNIRPYQCSQCELAFTASTYLKKHEKNFHSGGRKLSRNSYVYKSEAQKKSETEWSSNPVNFNRFN